MNGYRWLLLPLMSGLMIAWAGLSAVSVAGSDSPALRILNLEKVNTPGNEDDPCLSADLLSLYYSGEVNGDRELLLATRRSKDAQFANGKPIEELCSKGHDSSPFPMPRDADGSEYIYFASKRDGDNADIFFTRRYRPGEPYQRIAIAGVHQVCTPEDELHPHLTPDGKEMYFSRKTKDGWRVGRAYGSSPRAFEEVELLSLPVGFCHPSVSKDGLTMYLQGPLENGRSGLFVSKRRRKTEAWGMPRELVGVTHPDAAQGDRSPRLTPDGWYVYFASDRPGGKGGFDLWYVSTADLRKAGN